MFLRFLACLLMFFLCSCSKQQEASKSLDASRIVSFAPSITEILFALGLGPNLVGVSRFCEYPPEAARLPRVGGMLDPNLEMVVRLKPSVVVLHRSNVDCVTAMQNLNLPCLAIEGTTLQDVLDSFQAVGTPLGYGKEAARITEQLQQRLKAIQPPPQTSPPRVLLIIYREAGGVRNFQVAAKDGYFSEIIRICGGSIVPEDTRIPFPALTAESVLQLKPDIILELLPAKAEDAEKTVQNALADWKKDLPEIPQTQIHIITDDYAVIPGPRFILLAEKIAKILQQKTTIK